MIAVILSAGIGQRLRPLTNNIPKSLLKINNTTILEQIVSHCHHNDVNEFLVVLGHEGLKVKDECRLLEEKYNVNIDFVTNEKYDQTNTSVSVLLALKKLDTSDDVILINGDNVFDKGLITDLKCKKTAMVVDNIKKLNNESFKIQLEKNKIIGLGKELDIEKSSGEFIGISKISNTDLNLFQTILYKMILEDPQNYYDLAYMELNKTSAVDIVFTNGKKWTEIDDITDWEQAQIIFPELFNQ